MRILHVILTVDPAYGGPIEGVIRGSEALIHLGHSREVVSLDPPDAEHVRNCPIPAVGLGSSRGPGGAGFRMPSPRRYRLSHRLVCWLRKHAGEYDAVIVNGLWSFASLGAWLALRRSKTPYFVFIHGMLAPWFQTNFPIKSAAKRIWWDLLEHRVLKDAAGVIYTSENERRLAHEAFGPYECSEDVVSYGTAAPPPMQAEEIRALRTRLGLADDPYFLFLGRLHKNKGCDILIKSFAASLAGNRRLRLVIAGPDQTGWRPELESMARELGISDQICWAGMLSGSEKWAAYHGCAAFLLPSHSESFGIVIAEAMACGKIPITTNKVNIHDLISSQDAGIITDDTEAAFTDGLRTFLGMSSSERAAMAARAEECFLEHFQIQAAASSLIKSIEKATR